MRMRWRDRGKNSKRPTSPRKSYGWVFGLSYCKWQRFTIPQTELLRLSRTNFSEAYQGLVHLKVIRLFVESVLRYGPPANFTGIIIQVCSWGGYLPGQVLDWLYFCSLIRGQRNAFSRVCKLISRTSHRAPLGSRPRQVQVL